MYLFIFLSLWWHHTAQTWQTKSWFISEDVGSFICIAHLRHKAIQGALRQGTNDIKTRGKSKAKQGSLKRNIKTVILKDKMWELNKSNTQSISLTKTIEYKPQGNGCVSSCLTTKGNIFHSASEKSTKKQRQTYSLRHTEIEIRWTVHHKNCVISSHM